jgi:hypothetical protein
VYRNESSRIPAWNAGLSAQGRDKSAIDKPLGQMVATVSEKKVNQFSGFPVQCWWLVRPFPFPGLNCFSYYSVHWLGEGGTRLVNGHVEETCSTSIGRITSAKIPSDATDSQSANFVAA